MSREENLYVSISACPYLSWGVHRAEKFKKLVGAQSSYQITERLNAANIKCSVANTKKYLSGVAQMIPTEFAFKMCETLGIDAFELFPLHKTIDSKKFLDSP